MNRSNSDFVKKQFNKQAEHFNQWAVTKNSAYLKAITEFIAPAPCDTLLDVACGTGELTLFMAPHLKNAIGIDIADRMIEIALRQKGCLGIDNIDFKTADVFDIPFPDDSFDIIFSKSAFHHISEPLQVFGEMARCCKPNGKIGICDILAFDDAHVDGFFERLEKAVDPSHYKTLSKNDFTRLLEAFTIKTDNIIEVEIEHPFSEYLSHAIRSRENEDTVDALVSEAKNDASVAAFWKFGASYTDTIFRKKVILLIGRK
jgi:ubiquinone/menaquinone biosynthesis C-methylase UbiE